MGLRSMQSTGINLPKNKTLYQEIGIDVMAICDTARGLKLNTSPEEFNRRLVRLQTLIESYFGLVALSETKPLKVGEYK